MQTLRKLTTSDKKGGDGKVVLRDGVGTASSTISSSTSPLATSPGLGLTGVCIGAETCSQPKTYSQSLE
jgi:hypothetical protein